jgi:hypothetical protein
MPFEALKWSRRSAIDAHVKNIRRKLERDPHSRPNTSSPSTVGYKFAESAFWSRRWRMDRPRSWWLIQVGRRRIRMGTPPCPVRRRAAHSFWLVGVSVSVHRVSGQRSWRRFGSA